MTGDTMADSSMKTGEVAFERHYTIAELAELWHLEYKKVQRMFLNEPGVLKEVSDGTLKKRRYTTIRVPESVAVNVHRKKRAA
jgi:hypothetical protein